MDIIYTLHFDHRSLSQEAEPIRAAAAQVSKLRKQYLHAIEKSRKVNAKVRDGYCCSFHGSLAFCLEIRNCLSCCEPNRPLQPDPCPNVPFVAQLLQGRTRLEALKKAAHNHRELRTKTKQELSASKNRVLQEHDRAQATLVHPSVSDPHCHFFDAPLFLQCTGTRCPGVP